MGSDVCTTGDSESKRKERDSYLMLRKGGALLAWVCFHFFRVEETLAGNKREYKKRLKITLDLSET